jgi:uncharacterized membrane protein
MTTETREQVTTTEREDGRFADTRTAEARRHEEFGGFSKGCAFFGWLVAVGIAVLLLALLSAAGTAVGITNDVSEQDVSSNAGTVGIVGGALVLLVLAIAYYAGGYVAGRMARFDGARQGFGVWMLGLVITVVLAVAGALFGAKYNVLHELNLPRIPIDEGSLTTGGVIALIGAVLLTLFAAVAGGKVGERFHRRVDRVV